jgi:hypothetical protein
MSSAFFLETQALRDPLREQALRDPLREPLVALEEGRLTASSTSSTLVYTKGEHKSIENADEDVTSLWGGVLLGVFGVALLALIVILGSGIV